ncbi:MAG: hypothetical protein R2932_42730 [Caldilineaceae bacterium]
MLTKPNLPEQLIVDQLRHAFNWPVTDLIFLPLDADRNTAVYRAATSDGRVYFIKVRLGDFRSTSVTIPDFLYQQGMRQLIPPLATQNGQLWMALDSYQIIAYPFVPGQTGYTHGMTTAHWADFGLGYPSTARHDAASTPGKRNPARRLCAHLARTDAHVAAKRTCEC